MEKVYIYKIFERFWHWAQVLLIVFLMITGFEIHGSFELFGFENSVQWHQIAAWAFLTLIVFAIFWHVTSGEWRQYIPTTKLIKNNSCITLVEFFKMHHIQLTKQYITNLTPYKG